MREKTIALPSVVYQSRCPPGPWRCWPWPSEQCSPLMGLLSPEHRWITAASPTRSSFAVVCFSSLETRLVP